ncbi:MAG: type I DNA topoisomerase [Bacilli bacterium]|nr:type I DNA topoisomerase [Bacilli bacterium]MBR6136672.1 type I DNA topoisomerase [Bacilli bacterium]
MTKNLVIVESPSKSKTIEKYLGGDYKVVSSKGHIRDLATSGHLGLGVDIENGFKPNYVPIKGKEKVIKDLKKDVKDSEMVYLASDPDREGEAIAWHLKDTLGIKDKNYKRVLFNEITHDKVLEAMENPTVIDDNLVKSQETRRILDRIIGFRLSKLLQSKIGAKSAGRVQSVALKLIVDREREIENFNPVEYWTVTAHFDKFDANYFKTVDNKDETKLDTEEEADDVLNNISDKYRVENIDTKKTRRSAKYPFTTSTLQQEASTKLGFPARKTMSVAQKLYEGIDLGDETVGLITYMRTDSIRLSDDFVRPALKYIEEEYGKEYVGHVKQAKKNDNVQDAHEGIRPTSVLREPTKIKSHLSNDEFKLYSLIYKRTIASLMADALLDQTTVILNNNNYKFKTTGSIITFLGYLKVYGDYESSDDNVLPKFVVDEIKTTNDVEKEQHFTQPPARYTEARLIKELEELGIGRPSTYATIIDTIKSHDFVTLEDKKFKPTSVGIESTDKLQEFFSDIINTNYTSEMETDLDEIAEGKMVWNKVLDDFYKLFEPRIKSAFSDMEKKAAEETGETCPECGSPLVKRKGKYGEFVACSNYPTCKYIQKEEAEIVEICDCPNCDGKIVEKKSRKGKVFYGCNHYPKCKTAYWDKPIDKKCPECGEMLTEKNGTIKCSSCDYKED